MQKQKQKIYSRFRQLFLWTVLVFTAVVTALFLTRAGPVVQAATGVNEQLNYQARLLTSEGAVVPDGLYNMEFKIYQDGDGVLGGGDETLKWTETRESGNKVQVKNGYFTVYLGSVTPFGSSVDWNQDTLWLSVNIGGTATPSYDGEMSPFTRLSSTPYAINSSKLGGLTSSQFVRLAQGVQADASTTASSIFINKTGSTANILQLQRGGSDVFVLGNGGAALLKTTTNSTTALQVQNSSSASLFTVSTATTNPAITVTSTASTTQVALVVNNSTSTGNIAEFRDNGTSVLTIADGGTITATGNFITSGNISTTGTGTITSAATITAGTGLTVTGGGATITAGNLALTAGLLSTNGTTRLTNAGALQNITGLTITSGGASITGGINNNSGGVTNAGALSGVTSITASGNISTSGNINVTGSGFYQSGGTSGTTNNCTGNNYPQNFTASRGLVMSFGCAAIGLSDARIKTNVNNLDNSILESIKYVNTVDFDFDCSHEYFQNSNTVCDDRRQTGVIAQQLAEVYPELVEQDEYGIYKVRYDRLNIYTLKAVVEMSKIIGIENDRITFNLAARNGLSIVGNYGEDLFSIDEKGNAQFAGKVISEDSITKSEVLAAIDNKFNSVFSSGLTIDGYSVFNNYVDFNDIVKFTDEVILAKETIFKGRPLFNNDTGGFATIEPGDTEVVVEFQEPFVAPPVVSVNNTDGKFMFYTYKDLTETGFTIVIQSPAIEETNFSWTAFAIDDALTYISSENPTPISQ